MPSESQRSRIRFHWRHAQKQPTRNTVAKKQAGQEDVDSNYLYVMLQPFVPGNLAGPAPNRLPESLLFRARST